MMKRKLVFATNNAHKLEEVAAILGDQVELLSLNDISCQTDIPETAETLEGNALLKSSYIYKNYHLDCFADDTGLEVEALNGAPGVYSARYAGGEGHDAQANMLKLLHELEGKENRKAQFRTAISLILDGKEYLFEGVKASPKEFAYRNKMEFSFGDEYKDGPLALGMHKRGSFHDIVNVTDCQIVDEDYRKILACTLECARESGLPYYHRMRHVGYFRHLLVRKAVKTGEILVDLVTASDTAELGVDPAEAMKKIQTFKEAWLEKMTAMNFDGTLVGILHTKNDSLADVVKDEGTEVLFGQDYFYEELLGLKFKITPFSFFQTNSLGAEVLYETAREYIGDTNEKVVFDLYSGTGTIAQILAPVAKKVVGVEIVEEAVEAAKENAKLNNLDNCTFWAGDVLKVIDELGEVPDLIMLDPPRDGVNPKALMKILNFGVERLVYIACKPTSLARDLEMIQGRGYKVEKISGVDLFPGTYHVETVCLLVLRNPVTHINIDVDVEEMVQDKRGLATYGQIKDYVLEQNGLKVSSLYIAQVKQKHGIIERDNYNKPKSEDVRQPQCPPDKERAITEALKHFGMI